MSEKKKQAAQGQESVKCETCNGAGGWESASGSTNYFWKSCPDCAPPTAPVQQNSSALIPAGWQRRLLYSATPGEIPQWQQCQTSEAESVFDRSPGHEYRQVFALEAGARTAPVQQEPVYLTEVEKTELLDWVSACQSAYSIELNPKGPFRPLPDQLQCNRQALVGYVNELIASRTTTQPAPDVAELVEALQRIAHGYTKALEPHEIEGHFREIARAALAKWGDVETEPHRHLIASAPSLVAKVAQRESTTAPDVAEIEPLFYLQDTRSTVGNCPLWWRENGNGYTTDLREAHKYTFDEAMRQHQCRETDLPWPCQQIDAIQRITVDVQYMGSYSKQRAAVAALANKGNGNEN